MPHHYRIKGVRPCAIFKTGTGEVGAWIKQTAIVLAAFEKSLRVIISTDGVSQVRHSPVIIRVFHCFADRFLFFIAGYVTQFSVVSQTPVIVLQSAFAKWRIGRREADSLETFYVSLRDHRTG